MMILVAGPYRSGTGDDPALMKRNLERLEAVTLPLFRAGHVPLIGEWLALPLLRMAGANSPADPAYAEICYPIAHRLVERCDAVLRLPGESAGADEDVRRARLRGLPVYTRLENRLGAVGRLSTWPSAARASRGVGSRTPSVSSSTCRELGPTRRRSSASSRPDWHRPWRGMNPWHGASPESRHRLESC